MNGENILIALPLDGNTLAVTGSYSTLMAKVYTFNKAIGPKLLFLPSSELIKQPFRMILRNDWMNGWMKNFFPL